MKNKDGEKTFVKVVRCKDCKFRKKIEYDNQEMYECENSNVTPLLPTDYCSFGVK